jgi:1-deoxyxylulose-5-phosphate synthase
MEYVRLGSTGLKVSRLALGCMSYGDPSTPGAHEWSLNDEEAQPFFRQAVELGVTFWDTANTYQAGTSEELVGRAIKRYSRRENIVLATKVHGRMHDGPGGQGLSRKAILEQIDASLARLGTDYVDLYQIHRFDRSGRRWRRCTTSLRRARSATSGRRRCMHGSSPSCSMPPT